MDKEYKNIDDLFQSELGGEKHAAPDFVKQNIDRSLGFQSKRRGLFLLGSIALIGIVFTSILFSYRGDKIEQEQTAVVRIAIPKTLDFQQKKKLTETQLQLSTNEAEMNTLFALNRNYHTNQPNKVPLIQPRQNPAQTTDLKRTTARKTDGNSTQTNKFKLEPSPKELEPTQTELAVKSLNEPDIISESIGNNSHLSAVSSTKNGTDFSQNENDTITTREVEQAVVTTPIIDITALPLDETATEHNNIDTFAGSSEDENQATNSKTDTSRAIKFNNDETNQIANNHSETDIPEAIPSETDSILTATEIEIDLPKPAIYKPWMFSLTSGINKLNTAYTADKMADKTIYDNAASDLLGYQTNFDFSYRLKNGLAFGSGLGFSTFKEALEFKQSILETQTIKTIEFEYGYEYEYNYYYTVDTSGTIIDSTSFKSDSTYTLTDSNAVYTVDKKTREQKTNGTNTVTYFHVPVSFGTQIRLNKFQLDLFANLRFNFKLRSRGLFKRDDAIYSFNEANSIYKPFYMDVILGSKLHYNIWNNLYLTGTAQYRPVMGVAYKNVPFNKSFDYLHVGIGFSLRL